MAKYQVLFHMSDGEIVEDDNFGSFYKTEEEAIRAAECGLGEFEEGAEDLEMSNSGDYQYEEGFSDDITYEIERVE